VQKSLALLIVVVGCSGGPGAPRYEYNYPPGFENIYEYSYPPSFEYIDETRLKSTMWALALEVRSLEQALRQPADDPAAQQLQVTEILSRMEGAVDGISTPGRLSQHPLLNRNLPRFREQLWRARDDVKRSPPSYFFATELVGSCAACHGRAGS
jgi:hypothetical protein